ncbi:amidohydrolase [Oceanobacillus halotolerans]|uniref:amidohydrolase n=1 Tax=Oceanobacillus halotolerans TaxID=2663380 RepID=UPI0013DB8E87|nr:amidohydrolase [Oceanobacillus halotolerans]
MKLIKQATVYTVNNTNQVLENCDILLEDGKIKNIGTNIPTPEGVEVINAEGYVITPGLIDAHTHVGVWNDANESSHPYTPLMSAVDAINPQDDSFKDARSGGVTTVQTGAGSANAIGGIWSVVKTTGTIVEDMLLRRNSGLKGATGENPKNRYGQVGKRDPYTRMSIANWIRQGFQKAEQALMEGYNELGDLYRQGKEDLAPFIDVLQKKMPLRIHAHRADDIVTAIRIAKEFDINLSIEHCTEGFKVASYIKKSGYPVTVGPFMGQSGKYETRDMNLENPRILNDLGILLAINTDHPVTPIQYLSICAADAVKHGLNEMEALRAITINPAKITGVADRVGSIEQGKDADLVLWTHHPFQTKASVEYTLINGEIVYQKRT